MPLLIGFSCLVRVDGLSLVYHMWLEFSSVLSVLSHLLYILGEVEPVLLPIPGLGKRSVDRWV
jgi:hypothetical protein